MCVQVCPPKQLHQKATDKNNLCETYIPEINADTTLADTKFGACVKLARDLDPQLHSVQFHRRSIKNIFAELDLLKNSSFIVMDVLRF